MIRAGQFNETGEAALQRTLKEEELRVAHERLLFHIENTPLGFIEWDNQLGIRSLSKRAKEILGWTKDEFIENAKTGFSQVYIEDLPLASKIGRQLISGEVKSNKVQYRNVTKNGNIIWCEWFNSVLKDKDGKVVTIMSLVQDITEQKKNEERLIYQQSKLKEAQAIARVGNWEVDMVLKTEAWSDELYNIFGVDREVAATTELFLSCVHPDDFKYVNGRVEEAFETLQDSSFDFRFIPKNGDTRFGYCKWRFEFDKNKNPIRLSGIIQDVTVQKKAEENVKERENRFRSLIEKGKDMITLKSAEGTFLYLSPSVTHVLGYSNEEMTGHYVYDFIHSDDLPGLLEQTQVILKTPGSSFFRKQRYLHKNGTWVWCEGTATNMLHEPGVNALVSNFRDISERKLSELNRFEDKSLIQAIYTASLDAVIIIDADGMIVKWDDKSETLFGWKETDVAGMRLADIIIPDRYRERHNLGMRHYLKTGEGPVLGKTIDISALKKSGMEFDVSLSITPSQINGKKHFIGFIRDISEKKIAEQQREFDKNNLNALINNTDDLMWSVDKNFKLLTSNQKFDDTIPFMLGRSIGKGDSILATGFTSETLDLFKSFYDRAFAGETFTEIQHTEAPDESWSEISFHPIRKNEEVIGTACNARDITARILAEQERSRITTDLIQRNKDLEQFAYIVSHNLRAPVANILGTASALKDAGLSTEDKEILSEGLHESVVKLDNVVRDMGQILQVKREIAETPEKVCFSKLVDDIKISIKKMIEKDNVEIKYDFSEIDEFLVLKSYLHSIFYNLISNSLKYRRQQVACVIEITSHRLQNVIELVFTDNGMGIDLQKRGAQVFGLYKRFHPNIVGKGMGLFMVKTQVEAIGGKIAIKSEVDKGTEIKIEFDK